MSGIKFIDLFGGIGGFTRALERESVGGKCVAYVEIDKNARKTYYANNPAHAAAPETEFLHGEDIYAIDSMDFPDFDILCGGFPCQPFAVNGLRKGMDDPRAGCFGQIARILQDRRPTGFILENVPGLKMAHSGEALKMIGAALWGAGYHVQQVIINSWAWVPQQRRRIYFAGIRQDIIDLFDFPMIIAPPKKAKMRLGDIMHPENGSEPEDSRFTFGESGKVHKKYFITEEWFEHRRKVLKRSAFNKKKGPRIMTPNWGYAYTLISEYKSARAESMYYRKAPDEAGRWFTPRECARLMGFEKPNRVDFQMPVIDSHMYRQFGNAVVPDCAEYIAVNMLPLWQRAMDNG